MSHHGDEAHYRKQAGICRDQASMRSGDPGTRDVWLKLAAEYDQLADTAARIPERMAPDQPQSQPVQQQQQKKKDE